MIPLFSAKNCMCDCKREECSCFDSYDGMVYGQIDCPNDCPGRGICMTQFTLVIAQGATYVYPWDAEKHVD